jgi:hypothetical protein
LVAGTVAGLLLGLRQGSVSPVPDPGGACGLLTPKDASQVLGHTVQRPVFRFSAECGYVLEADRSPQLQLDVHSDKRDLQFFRSLFARRGKLCSFVGSSRNCSGDQRFTTIDGDAAFTNSHGETSAVAIVIKDYFVLEVAADSVHDASRVTRSAMTDALMNLGG